MKNVKKKAGRKKGTPNRPKAINVMKEIVDIYTVYMAKKTQSFVDCEKMINTYSLATIALELLKLNKRIDKINTLKNENDV